MNYRRIKYGGAGLIMAGMLALSGCGNQGDTAGTEQTSESVSQETEKETQQTPEPSSEQKEESSEVAKESEEPEEPAGAENAETDSAVSEKTQEDTSVQGRYPAQISQLESDGVKKDYFFDENGDLIRVETENADGTVSKEEIEYVLDGQGNKVYGLTEDSLTATCNLYDYSASSHERAEKPLIQTIRVIHSEQGLTAETTFSYDADNRIINRTKSLESDSEWEKVDYTYEEQGGNLIVKSNDKNGDRYTYQYNEDGFLTLQSGSFKDNSYDYSNEYSYDNNNWLTAVSEKNAAEEAKTQITRDEVGNILRIEFSGGFVWEYEGYDTNGSRRGEITNPVVSQETEPDGSGERERQMEYLYEKPGLTKQEEGLDNAAKFDILTAGLEELESAILQMEDLAKRSPDLAAGLEEYRLQVEEINAEYGGILEYSVQNFEAKYDESGIEKIQEINSKNHAIGEIAKYTPYGIVINLLTASTIADNDIYYEGMQSANEAFSKAYQNAALEARNAVAALEARTDFYKELVAESEEPEDEYKNMYLLQYMLGDGKVDVEQYGQEVKKDLYLLAMQIDAMGRVYGSLYIDQSAANAYAEQYRALMDILDPEGSGEVALLVSAEEYAETLQPVLEAGVSAIIALQNSPHPNVDNKLMMLYRDDNTPGGKMRYCLSAYRLIHVYHSDNWVDIYYYSDGEPLCIDGCYVYNGLILNGTENTDAATACEEARWIYQNVMGDQRNFQVQCAEHIGRLNKALGRN